MIQWRSLGVPVRDAALLDVLVGPGPGEAGPAVYLSFQQVDAPCFVLGIEVATGRIRTFPGPGPGGITALGLTADRGLYGRFGEAQTGWVRLDPETGRFRWSDQVPEAAARLQAAQLSGGWRVEEVKLHDGVGPGAPDPETMRTAGSSFVGGHEVIVRQAESGEVRRLPFGYRSAGAPIHRVVAGARDRIYGLSLTPLRLFAYHRRRQAFSRLGGWSGESDLASVDALAVLDDALYLGCSPGARLLEHREALRLAHAVASEQAGITALGGAPAAGCLYVGTTPGEGGAGLLGRFEPAQGSWRLLATVPAGHGVSALAVLPGGAGVVAGTSILPSGPGGEEAGGEAAAGLYHWDAAAGAVVSRTVPAAGARSIEALAGDGERVYGLTARGDFFVWKPGADEPEHAARLAGRPYRHGLSLGEDGRLYAAFGERLVAIDRTGFAREELGHCHGASGGWALVGDEVYLAAGVHLMEGQLPPEGGLWA